MATQADERRASDATGERAQADRPTPERNVSRRERVASAVLGGVLLARGLRQRSTGGTATAVAGSLLVARGVTGYSRLYRALGRNAAADREESSPARSGPTRVERSVTVGLPADELEAYWRDPDHLARILGRFADVEPAGEDRLRWTVAGPLDRSASWEMRLVEDRPGEMLRWTSEPDAPVPNEWTVRFRPAPTDRGTQVTLTVAFDPPGGKLGEAAMDRLGVVPKSLAGTALDRFKSLAETGEIPTTERNPSARGQGDLV